MRLRMRPILRLLLPAILLLAGTVVTARAAVEFDITAGLPLGDDDRIFLNVTNSYYAPQRAEAVSVIRRCPDPVDDYPAVLLLARASHRSPAAILDLRLGGLDWAEVMYRMHVSPSVLFVGMDRDPGPPYGKAWGTWKQNPRGRLEIKDRHFVELAKLRVSAGAFGVSPYAVVAERRNGTRYENYVAERHRERARGRGKGEGNPGRGHGHGHEHGNDRDHGNDREHGHP